MDTLVQGVSTTSIGAEFYALPQSIAEVFPSKLVIYVTLLLRVGRRLRVDFIYMFLALGFTAMPVTQAQARYASIVVDAHTGKVLHETNADTRNPPASLVKIMTLYIAFEALENDQLSLDQRLQISRHAAGMPATRLGLRAGQTIQVKDAILAVITQSANDAAVVLAEALGGTEVEFARMMTWKARALGMSRTDFRNASGLPNRQQFSTARDMVTLARALLRDFPQRYHLFSITKFHYKGRAYHNHNHLLGSYTGTDGIKTGYIRASGFNLVASVKRDDRRVVAVVFGGKTARSRDRHMVQLLDHGFAKLASAATLAAQRPLPIVQPGAKTNETAKHITGAAPEMVQTEKLF
jgi:D-alanyl-D-alanine carboxypeptidase